MVEILILQITIISIPNKIKQKSHSDKLNGFSKKAMTYSPTNAVPSALTGLTTLFGMVRGEPRCNNHLKSFPS